ncbi:MAG: hypothetical protein D6781_12585 [Verrucomicrobia bacterium]|nr:MAG: hypothetical protein D6781_12585 [Verrucomicrobiota bacterium]
MILGLLAIAPMARSQPGAAVPAGTVAGTLTVDSVFQGGSDLDTGGSFQLQRYGIRAGADVALPGNRFLGASVAWHRDDFEFDGTALGLQPPWQEVDSLALALSYSGPLGRAWQLRLMPTITASGETSASLSDSLVYGGVGVATRSFAPGLDLGFGLGLFSGLEETRLFPFIAVRWEFASGWVLQNPFRPGPAGPAGLEVAFSAGGWDLGVGGAWRSYRFRLAGDGANPGGIGEYNGVPLFVRASRSLGPSFNLDLYLGGTVGGSLELEDAAGDGLARSDFDFAPLAAISVTGRF